MNYFKDKMSRGVKLRRELAISSFVSVWVVVAALFPFPPLSYLLDFNLFVKDAWVVQDDYEPPFGHAELLSLKVFSQKMDIDLAKAEAELRARGIEYKNADQTLEEIAAANEISPMNLYLLIKKFEPAPEPEKLAAYTAESIEVEFSGTGIGNKTLGAVCERLGLDPATALERLKATSINTTAGETLKNIAESNGTDPIEIMKTIVIDGYQPKAEAH
jgi:hypothetical protein